VAEFSAKISSEISTIGSSYEFSQCTVFLYGLASLLNLFYPKFYKRFFGKSKIWKEYYGRIIRNNETLTTKVIKYYYCCSSSIAYKSVLPDRPSTDCPSRFPFDSKGRRDFSRRISLGGKRAIYFATNLNNLRKGSQPVPQGFRDEAIIKYRSNITKLPTLPAISIENVREVVHSFGKISFDDVVRASNECVSVSASSESDPLGHVGFFMKIAPKISLPGVLDQTYNGVCPVPYFAYGLTPSEITGNAFFLSEPLKIRSITTQNAFEFSAGKPFQKCLSEKMKNHPNLLFGRMVEANDILRLYNRSVAYWTTLGYSESDLEFFSGDYEEATDGISPSTSRLIDILCFEEGVLPDFHVPLNVDLISLWGVMAKIFEYTGGGTPSANKKNWLSINWWFRCALESYGGIKVSYIRSTQWSGRSISFSGTKHTDVVQTFGQMMGDIKSFPVLCMLNLSLWNGVCGRKKVTVKLGNKFEKISAPCLVNGDDFGSFSPKTINDSMIAEAIDYNLKFSLGKSYRSKNVLVINSRAFMRVGRGFKEIPLCHLELCYSPNSEVPFWQNLDFCTEPVPYRRYITSQFFKMNRERIKIHTLGGKLNVFIPSEFGGCGAKLREYMKVPHTTVLQRAIVSSNKRLLKLECTRRKAYCRLEYEMKYFSLVRKKKTNRGGTIVEKQSVLLKTRNDLMSGETILPYLSSSYRTSEKTRALARDDWLANLSREKCTGKGYIHCKSRKALRAIRIIKKDVTPHIAKGKKDLDMKFLEPIVVPKSPFKFYGHQESAILPKLFGKVPIITLNDALVRGHLYDRSVWVGLEMDS